MDPNKSVCLESIFSRKITESYHNSGLLFLETKTNESQNLQFLGLNNFYKFKEAALWTKDNGRRKTKLKNCDIFAQENKFILLNNQACISLHLAAMQSVVLCMPHLKQSGNDYERKE